MEPFAFHAELFELRAAVLELLADEGFVWLSDFASVDPAHDIYGLEVGGVRDEADALAIRRLLRRRFPSWRHSRMYQRDARSREPGWVVVVSRDPEDYGDRWDRVG